MRDAWTMDAMDAKDGMDAMDEMDEMDVMDGGRDSGGMDRKRLVLWVVVSESGLLALGVLLVWWSGVGVGWGAGPMVLGLGAGTGLTTAVAAILLTRFPARFFRVLREDFGRILQLFSRTRGIDLVVASVLAGVCEEFFFRGFCQTWAGTFAGMHGAVWSTALLFGLVHAISFPYVVVAMVLGLAFGYLYHLTGSLPAVMLAHAMHDLVALWWGLRGRGNRGGVEQPPSG